MSDPKKAIILLSGGMDSAVAMAVARSRGLECLALSVDYGQRNAASELPAASRVAKLLGAEEHCYAAVRTRGVMASPLTGRGEVPRHRSAEDRGVGVAPTYVPARNLMLLSLALAMAETKNAASVWVGFNADDAAGYPDCRPEFLEAFAAAAALGQACGRKSLESPLIGLRKGEIVSWGRSLGAPLSETRSCYDPSGSEPCGACDACLLRREAEGVTK